jgi:hypothetical protein
VTVPAAPSTTLARRVTFGIVLAGIPVYLAAFREHSLIQP